MITEKIKLSAQFPMLSDSDAYLSVYVADKSPEIAIKERPAIVIFPGGGYEFTSDREAEPVALCFLSMGFNAFVVRYSVAPRRYPTQLLEASAAVALVRQNAEKWNTVSSQIAVCGFSAGGHLAGSLGTLWNEPFIAETLGTRPGANRPDAMILSYPVITSGEKSHAGSFQNLLGENPEPLLMHKLSLENSVGTHTPPTFLWHTADDNCVPSENSLLMAAALKNANVPFELHIYNSGVHGLSLCTEQTASSACQADQNPHIMPRLSSWASLCGDWLRETMCR